jgi:hypothetical protein
MVNRQHQVPGAEPLGGGETHYRGGSKMKFIRIAMALVAAGTIASTSALLADKASRINIAA